MWISHISQIVMNNIYNYRHITLRLYHTCNILYSSRVFTETAGLAAISHQGKVPWQSTAHSAKGNICTPHKITLLCEKIKTKSGHIHIQRCAPARHGYFGAFGGLFGGFYEPHSVKRNSETSQNTHTQNTSSFMGHSAPLQLQTLRIRYSA